MTVSVAASHARGKFAVDKIFGASALANEAVLKYGKDKVVNATIGAILDEEEKLVCLPVAEKIFRNLPMEEIIAYAPIAGMPAFLEAAIGISTGDSKPEAYIEAVATAGGSGGIHHVIANYSEIGDTLLTSDWYWGPYNVLCGDAMRKLDTYKLLDENLNYNIKSFESKVNEILAKQNNLVILLNTPAHNPTGYSLTNGDWGNLIGVLKESAKNPDKRLILFVDIAYIDYAGEYNESRAFMKHFANLPDNILVVLGFSMSKSYTMYGQRTGAMIGISSSKEIAKEFADINQYTSRATWSNINRACMKLLAVIYNDKTLLKQSIDEQAAYYRVIQNRADIFVNEAKAANLKMLPYAAGFFLSIPSDDSDAVCTKLHAHNIFAVPLKAGVRVAACAVPSHKMKGMAAKIAEAMK
ncbi:MAG: aminotransferase class I/II-fold pyridoxal phosphate-dependent enzyme [Sporomusaceae bacterium]|jgi:aromatic-amino-acid transaminase|nr:aminotransferase class I/II-fold pyridoxal phosphate-dependent enzyme [Sporomusaceae bacterium]